MCQRPRSYAEYIVVEESSKAEDVNIYIIIPTNINNTGGLPKELEIFVGTKIEHRRVVWFS